ncbi:MAG: hypothetical protein PHW34_12025 [Hespellia sp.]|nr:hypothetical protein [Hespellia sp.]
MSTILVWKEQLQTLYAKYATYVDKALKIILGLAVFGIINSNLGYMKLAASPLVTIGLSVVCAFLPLIFMVVFASLLVLAHLYSISLAVMGVAAAIFIVMYIFYFRFTPKKAWLVLLTPIAFALKVPYLIPIALGLMATPVSIVPIACGTVTYYMLHYVHTSSAALKGGGADGLITSLTSFAKQAMMNKEMWVMIIAFAFCLCLVYLIRTKSADHSWKIAIVTGAISNIVVIAIASMVLNVKISYGGVIFGSIVAVGLGFVLEILFFAVDYTRTERMQFEDDEYYYYVKAVPKLAVSAPKKQVSRINEHKDTAIIDTEDIKKVAAKRAVPQAKKQQASVTNWKRKNADEILLTRSLNKDLKERQPKQ